MTRHNDLNIQTGRDLGIQMTLSFPPEYDLTGKQVIFKVFSTIDDVSSLWETTTDNVADINIVLQDIIFTILPASTGSGIIEFDATLELGSYIHAIEIGTDPSTNIDFRIQGGLELDPKAGQVIIEPNDGTITLGDTIVTVAFGFVGVQSLVTLLPVAVGIVPNNTLFIDSSDLLLKFKDDSGIVGIVSLT